MVKRPANSAETRYFGYILPETDFHRASTQLGGNNGDHYEETVRRGLVADHRMSELLGRALSHRKGVRISAGLAALTPWTRRNFARWLFEDYPRAMIATPRRWHRGAFTGPGAYAHVGS